MKIKNIRNYSIFLSIFSGIFLIFSFPNFLFPKFKNFTFLVAWIALIPLIIALEKKNLREAFCLGLITGFIYFLGSLYWIGLWSILGLIFLSLYLGLYVAIFSVSLNFIKSKKYSYIIIIIIGSSIWTSLELIRTYFLTGFPWLLLGYSQYTNIPLIQICSFTGVYGVSFFLVLFNLTVASLFFTRKKKYLSFLLLILFIFIWGERVSKKENNLTLKLKVGLVQGNINTEKRWSLPYVNYIINTYKNCSVSLAQQEVQLIIWPESTLPDYLVYNKKLQHLICSLAKKYNVYFLIGGAHYELKNKTYKYYNSAFFISPQGLFRERYDKIHLVPFGEYIPAKKIFAFVEKYQGGLGNFEKGNKYSIFKINNNKFGTLICFEVIFPEISRKLAKEGNFLVNITNDSWFGFTAAAWQHASMSIFRAVENKVPLVRVANTGVSLFADSTGRILISTDLFVKTHFKVAFQPEYKKTFYTKFGNVFSYLCLLFSFLFLISGFFKTKKC